MLVRPSIALVENNKILLLKYNYSGNEVYGIPGGNPETGDSLVQTVSRELKEELHLEVRVGELLLMGEVQAPEKGRNTLHCVFRGSISGGTAEINPVETSALEACWVDIDRIDALNLYPNVGRELKKVLASGSTGSDAYIGRINQKWF